MTRKSRCSVETRITSTVETANESALVHDGLIVAIPQLSGLTSELVDVDCLADLESVAPEQSLPAHHVGTLKHWEPETIRYRTSRSKAFSGLPAAIRASLSSEQHTHTGLPRDAD